MRTKISSIVVSLLVLLLSSLVVSCNAFSKEMQKETNGSHIQTPEITKVTSTVDENNVHENTPPEKRKVTPTVMASSSDEPFRLYSFLPGGEYLIIGILKQFALSLDGEKRLSLPSNVDFISSARISPDGSKIVIVTSETGVPNSVFFRVIDPVSGSQADIPRVKGCISANPPGWSPDASSLIFACVDKIVMISIPDGVEKGRMTFDELGYPNPVSVNMPLWSPDGKWIAYRFSDGRMDPNLPVDQVIVFPADCFDQPASCLKSAKKFSFKGRSGYNLFDWTLDNELIMLDQESARVILYDIISGNIVQSISLPSTFTVENFAVSPDGTQIAFGQRTADKKEAAIYVASLKNGSIKKIYAENYRVDINFVNIWIKTR